MDNTEKIIRAWLKCEGYEIEEIFEQKIPSGQILIPHDYKVIKKQEGEEAYSMAELIAHSDAWNAICDYVLAHKEDIESGINDFETLKPVWDFFNRNTEPFTLEDVKHEFGEIDENIRYGNL